MRIRAVAFRIPRLAATVCLPAAFCFIFAMLAPSAQAAVTHEYLTDITEIPASSGVKLTGDLSAVNSTTVFGEDLWVAEKIEGGKAGDERRVDEFNASTGAFVSPQLLQKEGYWGIAVGEGAGERQVYVSSIKGVEVFGPSGSLLATWTGVGSGAAFTDAGNVAVDESKNTLEDPDAGDVYVADYGKKVVDVFKPKAGGVEEYVGQIKEPTSGTSFTTPRYVAIDEENGDVFVYDSGAKKVDVFEPEALGKYKFLYSFSGPGGTFGSAYGSGVQLAADGAAGYVYVVEFNTSEKAYVVLQFTLAGAYVGKITGASIPSGTAFGRADSVAVSPSTHDVYVGVYTAASETSVIDVFGPSVLLPSVTTSSPSSANEQPTGSGAIETRLEGEVNPEGSGPATCQFVWGTTESFDHTAPCSTTVAEGDSPEPVNATITGLEPDTTYYYRLQATSDASKATNTGEASQDEHFTTEGPGMQGGQWAAEVDAESARLDTLIDPHGKPSSYYFQYGTSEGYGSQTPQATIGSGEAEARESQYIAGLQASTLYDYRVVILSELSAGHDETFYGPNHTFSTQRSGESLILPDGRQWELVSPANKLGALIRPIGSDQAVGVVQAAADGGAVTYETERPIEADPQGYASTYESQVLSRRGADGWSSKDIATPHREAVGQSIGPGGEYRLFSPDLSLALVEPQGPFTPLSGEVFPEATERTSYLRHDFTCESERSSCYEPLVTGAARYADVPVGTEFTGNPRELLGAAQFVGATPDLGHVVLHSTVALTSTAAASGGLYEWSAEASPTERLQLVSLLPAGGGASAAAVLGDNGEFTHGAISSDGSRVFWSNGNSASSYLYIRDMTKRETVQVGTSDAEFQVANASGSRVFFTQSGALDVCEIVEVTDKLSCELTQLAPGVQGVLGAGEDGSYVYFVSTAVLASGAVPGGNNLYLDRSNGTGWEAPILVTTLAANDSPDWTPAGAGGDHSSATAAVSADGRRLAFMSDKSLTGYDNRDAVSGEPDAEVFLYDAQTEKLVCASCNPTGGRPLGEDFSQLTYGNLVEANGGWSGWVAANIPGWTPYRLTTSVYQSRFLSASGRLFFNSSDALAPQDVNGGEDVYEYEPPGVGDCTTASVTYSERSEGCVDLISSGLSGVESGFLDASESGDDVFFLTGEKLVPQDTDTALDVYDAHVCTTQEPCVGAPVSPPECTTAEACRVAPSPQPSIFGSPSSATFSGSGNVVQAVSTTPVSKPKAKPLTRAQKLARALKACAKKSKRKRAVCETQSRKSYGAKASKAGKSRKANASKRDRG